ncbi:hypothetical protein T05_13052 [Trichinella murrelli]|uniref:Uncharacterized protein n=1 Tax=Trichinella murrelli TaxID=144512 RepID=A0A0V0TTY6_9BILA|nr:hypothetical protein T05_13052 [Trichinella murrelli]
MIHKNRQQLRISEQTTKGRNAKADRLNCPHVNLPLILLVQIEKLVDRLNSIAMDEATYNAMAKMSHKAINAR